MKKYKWYFMAFLIPIVILGIYILLLKGNLNSLFINDLKEQYIFLFDYWKQILNGKQSFSYAFSIGLGESFIGTYAYYLASPFNWLLFFIPKTYILLFVPISILVKIGLSGLTMYIYLKNSHSNKDCIHFMFSICYALMGFTITYYFNIMWLDVLFLTPLVILGLENIIADKGSKLYIITLFISIISQYYMAFMLCIYCVLYFFYRAYILKKMNKKLIQKFIFYSLIVGLLSAFFTVPVLLNLTNIYRENTGNSVGMIQKVSNLFVSLGIHQQSFKLNYNYPVIYCGLIQIVLVTNYIIFEKSKRKKRATIFLLSIFVLSILSDVFIRLWHGGSFPYSLLYRFSFLISFTLITTASSHFSNYQPLSKKNRNLLIFAYFLLLMVGYLLNGHVDFKIIGMNVLFFYATIVLLDICTTRNSPFSMAGLIVFVLIELFLNMRCSFIINENLRLTDQTLVDNNRFILYEMANKIGDATTRIEGENYYQHDELLPIGKGSITLFLSSNNKNMFRFLSNSGHFVTSSQTMANPDNYFLNSLLGVKYWYGESYNPIVYREFGKIKIGNDALSIYENPYVLSLGYLIQENKHIDICDNPFAYQNQIVHAITGKAIYNPLLSTRIQEHTYEVELNGNDIYIYVESESDVNFYDIYANIYIDDELVATKNVMETIFKIENHNLNQVARIRLEYITPLNYEPKIYFYEETVEENIETLRQLQQKELRNIEIHNNQLEGKIDVDEDAYLMLTIPYEKGFTILVDNQKTSSEKIYDTFLGIYLTKGNHSIQVIYKKPYGIDLGIGLSGCTIFALLFSIFFKNVKKRKI